jgi:hypothetical protein
MSGLDEDDPDELELEESSRYREIPSVSSNEGYQHMQDFIEILEDATLRKLLAVAISGKGAFRRFKDVLLDFPQERQQWFTFKSQKMRERVLAWLRDEEIEYVNSHDA